MGALNLEKAWKSNCSNKQGFNGKDIMAAKKYDVWIEKTPTGFSAYAEALDVFSTGSTIAELKANMCEALELALEEEGVSILPEQLKIRIDLSQFFSYYKVLNARFLAAHIGMNPTLLSQYVKGKKKPSSKQTERIINGIHQIGKELSEITLI